MAHLEEALYRIKELSNENEGLLDLLEEVFLTLPSCPEDLEQRVLSVLDKAGGLQ